MEQQDFNVPAYVLGMQRVDTFAEIDEIFRSPDFVQGSHRESAPFFGDSLLLTEGPEHMTRRRMVGALFSKAALHHYENQLLTPVIEQVISEIKITPGPDGLARTDLVPLVRTVLHRISATVTGVDGVETPEQTERFRWLVEKLGAAVTVEWSTFDHAEVIREGLEIKQQLIDEFLQSSLDRRRVLVAQHQAGDIPREALPIDLFTLLLLHWDENWDVDYPWREAALFLVASTQTTTHTLPHVVKHLAEWFEDHPEDRAKVAEHEFLRLAAVESLRLHQPAPTLLRIASKDTTLASGRQIGEGERVALFFTPANRETKIFGPDANEFNPYRKVPANIRPWGLTFGGGPHLCIGRPLVTGLSTGTGDDSATDGTMIKILSALYNAGVEMDPQAPPVRSVISHHDAFDSFPVILRH